jgi:hypothetical protein
MRALPKSGLVFALAALTTGSAIASEPLPGDDSSIVPRVTIQLPVYTRHIPRNRDFNNQNWGAIIEYTPAEKWSFIGGYFKNSYDRDTVIAGVGWYPITLDASKVRFDVGGIAAIDLSGGYKGYHRGYPGLAALSLRVRSASAGESILDRVGLAVTAYPAVSGQGSTAVNLALTYRL